MTRLTNAFSKKLDHKAAVAVYFHAPQFRADSQDAARDASDGGRNHVWKLTEVIAMADTLPAAERPESN